jgi:hypothetical protein
MWILIISSFKELVTFLDDFAVPSRQPSLNGAERATRCIHHSSAHQESNNAPHSIWDEILNPSFRDKELLC